MPNPTIEFNLDCDICQSEIVFKIQKSQFEKSSHYPVKFRYLHGNPLHRAELSLNKSLEIVDKNFKTLRSRIKPNSSTIEEYMANLKLYDKNSTGRIILKLCRDIPESLPYENLNSQIKMYEYGFNIGQMLSSVISSKIDIDILNEVAQIWKEYKMASNVQIFEKNNTIIVSAENCYENRTKRDHGYTFYHLNEGILINILQSKLGKSFLIKSEFDKVSRSCRFELQCQWNNFAERLRNKYRVKKKI
jgi:predicted hydrocarbon binding protein